LDFLTFAHRALCAAAILALDFADIFRRLRIGLAEMAEKVGSFLADVERGKRNISILNLELIADGLRLSLSQLLSRL